MSTTERFNRIAERRAADKARRDEAGTKERWLEAKRSRGDMPFLEQSEPTIEYEIVPVEDLVTYGAEDEIEIKSDGQAKEEDSGETTETEASETIEQPKVAPSPRPKSIRKVK